MQPKTGSAFQLRTTEPRSTGKPEEAGRASLRSMVGAVNNEIGGIVNVFVMTVRGEDTVSLLGSDALCRAFILCSPYEELLTE